MEPVELSVRLASKVVGPLVARLFVADGVGAGLVERPVRLSGYVSFRGQKRSLGEQELTRLAGELAERGAPGMEEGERSAVAGALARTLYALGDLTLTDVEAVGLGHREFARRLRAAAGAPERGLSGDGELLYEGLLDAACLHILHFFSQRSEFVARTVMEQSRTLHELVARTDALIARTPLPEVRDAAFEREWLRQVAVRHGRLTIYGIDLAHSPGRWALDAAYMRLEALAPEGGAGGVFDDLRTFGDRIEEGLRAIGGRTADGLAPTTPNPLTLPADQALARHDRVLLRGVAGSGKTTLVQWLAVSATRADGDPRMAYLDGRIPFVLPLRTLTRHGERLPAPADFLRATGSALAGSQPPGWEHRVLTAGRGLLLVDGIDEVPEGERARAREWLTELIDTYPGNRWLVTSRPSAVREEWLGGERFTEFTLAPMGPAEVATFIRRWHEAARSGSEDPELAAYERQLLDAVRAKPDLGRLAVNPLMCGLICALNRDRHGYLPRGRKELYAAALSMLLIRRDRERGVDYAELGEEAQIQLLQRLAYWLILNGRTEMDRSRAVGILAEALPSVPEARSFGDAEAVFDHFLQRSGLLSEPSPDTVVFVHRTFQDYLGAKRIVEAGDFGLLVRQAADDQWEDVVRMAVAHARPRERAEILRGMLDAARGPQDPDLPDFRAARLRLTLLAAGCLELAAELPPEIAAEVQERAEALIPPRTREEAQALALAGPVLLDLLPGPEGLDAATAEAVVIAASLVESERALPYLARFAEHPDLAVRRQLGGTWRRFDTEVYAEEVIARLDADGLFFTVHNDAELHALRRIGGRPLTETREAVSPEALTAYTDAVQLTRLLVRDNILVTDTDFVRGQHRLEHLRITGCPGLVDLEGLRGLPALHTLILDELYAGIELSPLATLPELGILSLSPRDGWSLDDLPALSRLDHLNLRTAPRPLAGLAPLAAFPGLSTLWLGLHTSPGSAQDWAPLGALPGLRRLEIYAEAFGTVPQDLALPGVEELTVRDAPLPVFEVPDRLASLCPGLRELTVDCWADAFDLTALRGLPDLRQVTVPRTERDPYVVHDLGPQTRLVFVEEAR
ncbi:hypothetical protein SRB5_43730 [Streptomyces sp. RB5]|uniref:NACHT domain-containing protein n=1 Tax=Streptomyces smaragdinus TaxID=2585196 RepID=A0A7K0CLB6_9ACTN|nr:NACHT domain-containing protein [Streptomyces smaragdinus]MQY14211.1 hypothetical protein [Streptomyces smaragdinus]